jgi:hypothetical protein
MRRILISAPAFCGGKSNVHTKYSVHHAGDSGAYRGPNDPTVSTEGPQQDVGSKDYQHPRYQDQNAKFSLHYDYYSLDVVLLEIGLWRPLKAITNLQGLNAEEAWRKVGATKVPLHSHFVGEGYCSAVKACPDTDSAGAAEARSDEPWQAYFEKKILSPLHV